MIRFNWVITGFFVLILLFTYGFMVFYRGTYCIDSLNCEQLRGRIDTLVASRATSNASLLDKGVKQIFGLSPFTQGLPPRILLSINPEGVKEYRVFGQAISWDLTRQTLGVRLYSGGEAQLTINPAPGAVRLWIASPADGIQNNAPQIFQITDFAEVTSGRALCEGDLVEITVDDYTRVTKYNASGAPILPRAVTVIARTCGSLYR